MVLVRKASRLAELLKDRLELVLVRTAQQHLVLDPAQKRFVT